MKVLHKVKEKVSVKVLYGIHLVEPDAGMSAISEQNLNCPVTIRKVPDMLVRIIKMCSTSSSSKPEEGGVGEEKKTCR